MRELATFAGGCFWCTEAIFKQVQGVTRVIPGYSGGSKKDASYEAIHTGNSQHAESVQIEFDPKVVSYEALLNIFFGTHNPTTRNRQGNDIGKEYRSAIFFHNETQRETAERVKRQLDERNIFNQPIVTVIEPFRGFYEAEPEHTNFYQRNPNQPYCRMVIDPKIAKFRKEFSSFLR